MSDKYTQRMLVQHGNLLREDEVRGREEATSSNNKKKLLDALLEEHLPEVVRSRSKKFLEV